MRCLVTGSRGFIGSHLTKELRKRGHQVIECDPKVIIIPNEDGESEDFTDIRNVTTEKLQGVDWVFHMGAASGSLKFLPSPVNGIDVNCVGTAKLLQAAKEAGVKKLVLSSTGSSYSNTGIPHIEAASLTCPNFYTATKIFDEHACKIYKEIYGLETIILRYASVYGDNEDKKQNLANVVSQFIWKMMLGEQPELWENGRQTRDFIFVDDVVYANIFAAENLQHGIFNVGTGIETTFVDLINKINTTLETTVEPKYVEASNKAVQKKYVARQLFDTNKLAARGWHFTVTIDEGIRRIVVDIKSRPEFKVPKI